MIATHHDKDEVLRQARFREREILLHFGATEEEVSGRHCECRGRGGRGCGGKDRFRFDEQKGFIICNQCFNQGNGNIIDAVMWYLDCSFSDAVNKIGEYLNVPHSQPVKREKPAPKKPAVPVSDQIERLEPDQSKFDAWAETKPPISGAAVAKSDASLCLWPKRAPQGKQIECIAFPAYGEGSDPAGMILYRSNGENFPAIENGPGERKTHLLKGSKDGWVISGDLDGAEAIIKVEGVPDLLALAPHVPDGYAVVTNTHGAKSAKNCPVDRFEGKTLIIIGDNDKPGRVGAYSLARVAFGTAQEVKVVFPDGETTETGGKDVRDLLNENHLAGIDYQETVSQLIEQAQNAKPFRPKPEKKQKGEKISKSKLDFTLTNFEQKEIEVEDSEDGETEIIRVPAPMSAIQQKLHRITGDKLKRCGSMLFAHEDGTDNEVHTLIKSSQLTGYVGTESGNPPILFTTSGYHNASEIHHEACRTAPNYDAIEKLPHEPRMGGHYYACTFPPPGNGDALRELLGRFNPATAIDADLILAAIVTLFWGGKSGQRPAFLITSDDGRGAGKTRFISMLSYLVGGHIELSSNEDIQVIKQRLLSPEGMTTRIALLDNVKTLKFSWAELEALITAPVISGKRMYIGEGTRPNNLTYAITLNGASLSTDIAQRCCIIKLAKPQYSGDWEDDTRAFIDQHRAAIIGDIIAFLRTKVEPIRACSRWGAWERDIIARTPEPTEAQKVIRERQQVADVDQEEAEIIEDHFRSKLSQCRYEVDSERVFLPSKIVTQWYGEATNERQTAGKVSRIMNQKINEGSFVCIQDCPSRANGRGFYWVGANWDCVSPCQMDLESRIDIYPDNKFTRF